MESNRELSVCRCSSRLTTHEIVRQLMMMINATKKKQMLEVSQQQKICWKKPEGACTKRRQQMVKGDETQVCVMTTPTTVLRL
jgi:hypothetical protein